MEAMVREGGLGPSNHSLVTGAGSHTLPPEEQIELIIIIITNSTPQLTSLGQNSSLHVALDFPGILRLYVPAPSDLTAGSSARKHHERWSKRL